MDRRDFVKGVFGAGVLAITKPAAGLDTARQPDGSCPAMPAAGLGTASQGSAGELMPVFNPVVKHLRWMELVPHQEGANITIYHDPDGGIRLLLTNYALTGSAAHLGLLPCDGIVFEKCCFMGVDFSELPCSNITLKNCGVYHSKGFAYYPPTAHRGSFEIHCSTIAGSDSLLKSLWLFKRVEFNDTVAICDNLDWLRRDYTLFGCFFNTNKAAWSIMDQRHV